ncbi:TrmB family transcriptional regulator [archaeon AH-315-M20]|nr:TrmB family transcriptional regulator [archaeon AH-315-M20]
MLTNQETIKKVKSLGLNTYEVKIWTALLSRGVSTAGELSDIANVPRSRSYDVLESLEKKGFVVMKIGKPIKYLAVPPKEVLERVKKSIEKKTQKHITHISSQSFNNLINGLQKMHKDTHKETENVIAILKGSKNIQKHLEFLFKNTEKDIVFSVEKETDKYFKVYRDIKYGSENVDLQTLNTGIRFCVVDDNAVVFPVSEEDTHPDYDLGIWIKDKQITKFLKRLLSFT